MANLRVTSTGKLFYEVDNAIAHLLMEAFPASFERVNPRPTPKPEDLIASWGVNVTVSGYHHVVFTLGSRTEFYDGPPSQLASHYQRMGIVAPESIVARYTPLWRPREFEHPAVHNAYVAEYNAIHGLENK
jgi:hypothetical protein